MLRLTEKQEKFVQGLLKGLSQREAYKQAYTSNKMSDVVIDVRACELLKNSKVSVRYEELRGKVIAESEKKTIADVLEIMEYWTSVMRGESQSQVVVVEGTGLGCSQARRVMKNPDEKERIAASKELAKRFGLDKPDEAIKIDTEIKVVW